NFTDATDVQATIDGLQSDITTLTTNQGLLQTLAGSCDDVLDLVTLTLLGGITCAQVGTTLTTVTTTLHATIDELQGLLQTVVDVLTQTPLLSIGGVNAGAFANAADTVANSAASVIGTIDHIK